jgi:hypothetical protein
MCLASFIRTTITRNLERRSKFGHGAFARVLPFPTLFSSTFSSLGWLKLRPSAQQLVRQDNLFSRRLSDLLASETLIGWHEYLSFG